MEQIILVSGKWIFQKNRWVFLVDKSKGCRILGVDHKTSFGDFLRMVYEDFGLDHRYYEVQLSYMLSKQYLQKLPQDTPPVFVATSRQFSGFLQQFQNETVRLCVEIIEKVEDVVKDVKLSNSEADRVVGKNSRRSCKEEEQVHEIDEQDEEYRFDNCEDPDGASSDDEEYGACGKDSDNEEDMQNLPPKKPSSTTIPDFVQMEMKSIDLAVGQCYETKEELETRLKIYAVANKFDFDVGYSTPKLLTVKCWVEGCKWRVRASTVEDNPRFHIKTFVGEHTCSVTIRSSRAR